MVLKILQYNQSTLFLIGLITIILIVFIIFIVNDLITSPETALEQVEKNRINKTQFYAALATQLLEQDLIAVPKEKTIFKRLYTNKQYTDLFNETEKAKLIRVNTIYWILLQSL